MKFYSNRNKSKLYSLKEAAFLGLAPDGGLFMPAEIPQANLKKVFLLADRSFADMALYLSEFFFGEDLSPQELKEAIHKALSFPVPLTPVGKTAQGNPLYTLELFHGPTFAFKDVGASCMGQILSALMKKSGQNDSLTILTATSGDTGSAVARGFYNIPGIRVVVLFPEGKVSPLQECQMTTLGKNIHAVKIRGTFDDCQKLVKEAFNCSGLRQQLNITSANSINLLRWLPQHFYYFYGYYQWLKTAHPGYDLQGLFRKGRNNPVPQPVIVVPSGNYGNLSAGMLAKKMGLPVAGFIAASNSNDVIPKYLKTGQYDPKPSIQTLANAMDVGHPSNYERILDLYNNDYKAICADVTGFSCGDTQIREGIRELYTKYNYTSCPHSAIGYNAAKHFLPEASGLFWLSTAHPAKFSEVLEETLGKKPSIPAALSALLGKERMSVTMDPDFAALKEYLITSGYGTE